ncbi:hypothetical protein ABBQ38_010996 [Trebouxia sp. C0009 RCD-2024]
MFSQNQAPWPQQPGHGSDMQQQQHAPGSQPWSQQRQMPPSSMQNNQQFPGFGNAGPSQQPWNGNQRADINPGNPSSGKPWMSQNQGGPALQQPQTFPPYYQQHQQQQPQQQPQQPSPQLGQNQFPSHQQGQQSFPSPQQDMPSNNAPWGQQRNQPWQQQQVSPQQQQAPPPQQMQGIPGPKAWIGTVTELIPPNYGIVDGNAFFINQVVTGKPPQIGEKVNCEAVVNTDGGNYQYRCTRVQVIAPMPSPMQPLSNAGMPGFMGAPGRPMLPNDYNLAPPPTNAYQTDLALAAAANSMSPMQMQPPVMAPRRVFSSAPKLDEEARHRSEVASQQLMQNYNGPPNVGVRLMSKMGYGVAGLGAKGQGIAAPVQPVSLDGNSGLGFQFPPPMFDRRPILRRRSSPPRRVSGPPARRGRSKSPARVRQKSSLSRSKSRSRSRSPRSPARHGGRYKCEPPKYPPYTRHRTIPDLSKRYADLYIPPEFCRAGAGWLDSLPDHKPLSLTQPVDFQVKKEDNPEPAEASDKLSIASSLSDAEKLTGSWWSAKVVLMGGVNSEVLHAQDPNQYQQPWKRLQFVVGRKGKHELMAIGGRWEPCDRDHPESNPQALVRTAVRTFQEASGVDLSSCTKWYHFAEFSYLRVADKKQGVPEHIEKTVLFLVDPSAVAKPEPGAQDLGGAAAAKQEAEAQATAAMKAAWRVAKQAKEAAKELEAAEKAKKEAKKEATTKAAAETEGKKEAEGSKLTKTSSSPKQGPKIGDAPKAETGKGPDQVAPEGNDDDESTPRDADGNELAVDLDTSKLTAAQLQEELTKRGLDVKWQPLKGKKVLVERLQEWVAMHRDKKAAYSADMKRKEEIRDAVQPAAAAYEEAKKALKEASAARRAAVRGAQDPPASVSLALCPNKDFCDKRTKFGIDVLSLEALLDYSENDVKECCFEVSMFAEMFKEMLQIRFARGLMRGLAVIEQEVEAERAVKELEKEIQQEKEREEEAQRQQEKADAVQAGADASSQQANGNEGEDNKDDEGAAEGARGQAANTAAITAAEPSSTGKDTVMIEADAEVVAGSASKVKVTQQADKEAVTEGGAVVGAVEGGKGSQNRGEGSGKGTKRPAEGAADGQAQAASALHLAPNAKRQKTDAEWGKSSEGTSADSFLLACRFFDRECAGYLAADDLEEIAFMSSDGISRRRVQVLVDNVTKHGKLRYLEHSQLQIPQALPPVAEAVSMYTPGAAPRGYTVSDKEWKTLLGKLASSEKVRRAADATIATREQEAQEAAQQYEQLKEEEQKAQGQVKNLKEQLAGMRASRFKATELLTKSLEGVQSSFAQLNAVKEQVEGAQGALRKVDTSKLAEGAADGKA